MTFDTWPLNSNVLALTMKCAAPASSEPCQFTVELHARNRICLPLEAGEGFFLNNNLYILSLKNIHLSQPSNFFSPHGLTATSVAATLHSAALQRSCFETARWTRVARTKEDEMMGAWQKVETNKKPKRQNIFKCRRSRDYCKADELNAPTCGH